MIRQIIKIDEEKCNGCELCAKACHEGAIEIQNGKAKLIKDDYCDGLGNCLPVCPTGAITFEMRDASPYDKEAQEKYLENKKQENGDANKSHKHECMGSAIKNMNQSKSQFENSNTEKYTLLNWPIQIKLMPVNAPYLKNASLLIAADCTAFAYPDFSKFIKDNVVAISCPKLDDNDIEKLTQIFKYNDIQKIKIVRMAVPCCGGLVYQVMEAIKASSKNIEPEIVIISPYGEITL